MATDEAGLLEALGTSVQVVLGIESNIKVTTPDDLVLAENILRAFW
jgi:2-C-methyl-D-erythritol 4-phosphate cytidylyltransferase